MGDAYLYLRYQPWYLKKSRKYTLQIETHPDHLIKFQRLLDALYAHTQQVYFSRCELAYDFPYPMSNVFIASNTGRKDASKNNAFCRTYDKKAERMSKGNVVEAGECTIVELVYSPAEKIPLESIIQYPPKFNDFYTCSVITDLQAVRAEKPAMILAKSIESCKKNLLMMVNFGITTNGC